MDTIPVLTHQPRLKVFSRRQALTVHSAALEILEKTGVKMEHEGARKLLIDHGARLYDNQWIRIPAYLAEAAIRTAPRQIMLYDQNGNKAMELRDDNFYYGTGSDTTFTMDLESGQRRRCVLSDTGRFARGTGYPGYRPLPVPIRLCHPWPLPGGEHGPGCWREYQGGARTGCHGGSSPR